MDVRSIIKLELININFVTLSQVPLTNAIGLLPWEKNEVIGGRISESDKDRLELVCRIGSLKRRLLTLLGVIAGSDVDFATSFAKSSSHIARITEAIAAYEGQCKHVANLHMPLLFPVTQSTEQERR